MKNPPEGSFLDSRLFLCLGGHLLELWTLRGEDFYFCFILFFFFFFFFLSIPTGYWMFQARGQIGAAAAAYTTATARPDPGHLWQRQIINQLSKARDQTRILLDTMSSP